MKQVRKWAVAGAACAMVVLGWVASPAVAAQFDVNVGPTDAIWLAGRTDVVIPPASQPWGFLGRHPGPTPEEALERMPAFVPVVGGDVVRVLDPVDGGINFFNGLGPPFFGPGGNGSAGSNLSALGGISGYSGPQGPLVGVFLDDTIPSAGPAPTTLDFTTGGLGADFTMLSPQLRQVFYIGDGVTSGDVFQLFTAPAGATRLFLGIPDGFSFGGAPGAYDDNDGGYRVRVGVNQVPDNMPLVPEPATAGLLLIGGLVVLSRRPRRAARR